MDIRNLRALLKQVTIKLVGKGELILPEKGTGREVYLVRRGLVRSYYTNDDGEEITFQLFSEYTFFGNVHTILYNEPSSFAFQALEPTKVYATDYESFQRIIDENPAASKLNRRHIGKEVLKQVYQRVESFVLLSPEERYLKYLQDNPSVVNRVPGKYIAHVLGITPVSLSRIRGRIAAKKECEL